eukprot:scaffold581_cov169-Amphora_coffeaeformis.AAC.7
MTWLGRMVCWIVVQRLELSLAFSKLVAVAAVVTNQRYSRGAAALNSSWKVSDWAYTLMLPEVGAIERQEVGRKIPNLQVHCLVAVVAAGQKRNTVGGMRMIPALMQLVGT